MSFNVVQHHNDLINYGLMANPMRGRTDQYLKTYISHRECVGLFLYRRRDKGDPIEKGGGARGSTGPDPPFWGADPPLF